MKFRWDKDILRFFGMSLRMILLGAIVVLFIRCGAYFFGGGNSFLLAAKESYLTPIVVAHVGIYSWAILVYYFVKKGDV